jgi:predicted nuclease of predicted toxin-antitoxin system
MSSLRLIADVHISPLTVAAIRSRGYDIVRSTDLLPPNATDESILTLARIEGFAIVTQDLDFSMLVALSNYTQPSLITLRLSSGKPEAVAQRLLDILPCLADELTEGVAVTVNDDTVRIRKLPIH